MKVTVEALFSFNHKIGAYLIAYGTAHLAPNTKEKVSHTAVLINGRWVHEATGEGVTVKSYELWSTEHTEVARVKLQDQEYQIIADHCREILGKKYDYAGVFYLGIVTVPTFVGAKLPSKNLWQSNNKYFCCELLGKLTGHDYSMSAPVQILERLRVS